MLKDLRTAHLSDEEYRDIEILSSVVDGSIPLSDVSDVVVDRWRNYKYI